MLKCHLGRCFQWPRFFLKKEPPFFDASHSGKAQVDQYMFIDLIPFGKPLCGLCTNDERWGWGSSCPPGNYKQVRKSWRKYRNKSSNSVRRISRARAPNGWMHGMDNEVYEVIWKYLVCSVCSLEPRESRFKVKWCDQSRTPPCSLLPSEDI